jgi:hypothetical protein
MVVPMRGLLLCVGYCQTVTRPAKFGTFSASVSKSTSQGRVFLHWVFQADTYQKEHITSFVSLQVITALKDQNQTPSIQWEQLENGSWVSDQTMEITSSEGRIFFLVPSVTAKVDFNAYVLFCQVLT